VGDRDRQPVSGLDQTVNGQCRERTGRSDVGITTTGEFIQTDASINPGNSGGRS